jgi:hypothetical protein
MPYFLILTNSLLKNAHTIVHCIFMFYLRLLIMLEENQLKLRFVYNDFFLLYTLMNGRHDVIILECIFYFRPF